MFKGRPREWIKSLFKEKKQEENNIIISYFAQRKFIGFLGILFPFICYIAGKVFSKLPLQRSISFYYYTNSQNLFVGVLICVSIFLITYKGFRHIENIISTVIGFAGFGIALFPCLNKQELADLVGNLHEKTNNLLGVFQVNPDISSRIHYICAIIFFLLLAINSIFLFTLSERSKDSLKYQDSGIDNKKIRNWIYRICGGIILISLLVAYILYASKSIDPEYLNKRHIIFFIETVMLTAFGISWLVKGKFLYDSLKFFGRKPK